MWIVSLAVSPISDYLINRGLISVWTGRRLFNSLGHWVPAIALIILPFLRDPTQAIVMLTIAVGMNGFTYCGYMVNHMDLSPNFAGKYSSQIEFGFRWNKMLEGNSWKLWNCLNKGSLMGLTNSLANIMSILGPITVGAILSDGEHIPIDVGWNVITNYNRTFNLQLHFRRLLIDFDRGCFELIWFDFTGEIGRMENRVLYRSCVLLQRQFVICDIRQKRNSTMERCRRSIPTKCPEIR